MMFAIAQIVTWQSAKEEPTVGPGVVIQFEKEEVSSFGPQIEAVYQIVGGTGTVVVIGMVFYQDAFGVDRKTEFLHLHSFKNGNWRGAYAIKGSHAT